MTKNEAQDEAKRLEAKYAGSCKFADKEQTNRTNDCQVTTNMLHSDKGTGK